MSTRNNPEADAGDCRSGMATPAHHLGTALDRLSFRHNSAA
jgi:hypothetical protein